jgi:hypothetical protein
LNFGRYASCGKFGVLNAFFETNSLPSQAECFRDYRSRPAEWVYDEPTRRTTAANSGLYYFRWKRRAVVTFFGWYGAYRYDI